MPLQWNRDALLANPVFASLWPVLACCSSDRFPDIACLSELARSRGVASGGGVAVRFVPAGDNALRQFGLEYETGIYREGLVPTRPDNFHDLFNALVWIVFPQTKAMLNRLHYREMTADGARNLGGSRGTARRDIGSCGTARKDVGSRGTARDVLTLFDEGGVIVACSEPELARLLREFQWQSLFWARRSEVSRAMRFFVSGHAIQEKALRPYKGLTAKALVIEVSGDFFGMPLDAQLAEVDERAAHHFSSPEALASTRTFAPLPILGVPGWAPENECEAFYKDTSVFRPGRRKQRA
jgi:hypothetical protein